MAPTINEASHAARPEQFRTFGGRGPGILDREVEPLDASEEILAILREIRDQQRRQFEIYEAWRQDSLREHREWREEWSRQAEIYQSLSDRYAESQRIYAESARAYDEANRLYIDAMKRAKWSGPTALAVLLLAVVGILLAASFGLFKVGSP